MTILVACEESQEICKAFRERGHTAFSCDLQECSGGHPEWHICGDVLPILNGYNDPMEMFITQDGKAHCVPKQWDMIIAHPPCTYLTNGGAVRLFRNEKKYYPSYGTFRMINTERLKCGIRARDFFLNILHSKSERIAVENPIPMSIFCLPKESQIIQPYEYGEPYSKKTCLWLKGLPNLVPTNICSDYHPFINGGGHRLERDNYKGQKFAEGSKNRSKTFHGIAEAMAEQWGNL